MRDAFHTPQYLGLERSQRLQLSSKSFVYFLEYFIGMSTAKFCTFTAEQQATAPHLDPSLEAVLRSHGVHDEVIMNFRCNDVLSQAFFVALDSSEEGLRSMSKDAFGIDLSSEGGFIHKREMAKVIASWKESRIQSETNAKVDAVARAHGEPVSYLPSEWVKILKTFKDKHGQRIPEYYFPEQCYFEVFEEKVNEGRLRAETLAQVISLEEEEAQERSKPEHPKQLHLNLEANLTLQTRRRFISQMPKNSGTIAYEVSSAFQHAAPAKLRQPGCALHRDLDERTWPLLLEELLNRKNFAFQRQLENSEVMVGPDWNHAWSTNFRFAKKPCDASVQHFGLRTIAPSTAWNIGSRFSQWPIPGQKRTNRPRTLPWKTKSTRSRSSLLTSGTTGRDHLANSWPSQKNLGQKSRVHVVAKVEVAEKAPEKVSPEAPALEPLQVQRVRRISKRSRRSMVSRCFMRKLDRVQESVSDSRSTRVSILENAGGSTSASAVAKQVSQTTIAASWNQQHEQSPLFLILRLKTFLSLSK